MPAFNTYRISFYLLSAILTWLAPIVTLAEPPAIDRIRAIERLGGATIMLRAVTDVGAIGTQTQEQILASLMRLVHAAKVSGETMVKIADKIPDPITKLLVMDLADRLQRPEMDIRAQFGGNYVWKQGDPDLSQRFGLEHQNLLRIMDDFEKLMTDLSGSLPASVAEPLAFSEKLDQREKLIMNLAQLLAVQMNFVILGKYTNLVEWANEERAFAEFVTAASIMRAAAEKISALEFANPALTASIHSYADSIRHTLSGAQQRIVGGVTKDTSQQGFETATLNLKNELIRLSDRLGPYVEALLQAVVPISHSWDEIIQRLVEDPSIMESELRTRVTNYKKQLDEGEAEVRRISATKVTEDAAVRQARADLEDINAQITKARGELEEIQTRAADERAQAEQRAARLEKQETSARAIMEAYAASSARFKTDMAALPHLNEYGMTTVATPTFPQGLSTSVTRDSTFTKLQYNLGPYIQAQLIKLRAQNADPINQLLAKHGVAANDYNITVTPAITDLKIKEEKRGRFVRRAPQGQPREYLVALDLDVVVAAPGYGKHERFSLPGANLESRTAEQGASLMVSEDGSLSSQQIYSLLNSVLFHQMRSEQFWQRLAESGVPGLLTRLGDHCTVMEKAVRVADARLLETPVLAEGENTTVEKMPR